MQKNTIEKKFPISIKNNTRAIVHLNFIKVKQIGLLYTVELKESKCENYSCGKEEQMWHTYSSFEINFRKFKN